jgi:hypothetical protein
MGNIFLGYFLKKEEKKKKKGNFKNNLTQPERHQLFP